MLTAAIAASAGAPASVAGVLQLLVPLYALRRIEADMAFFLTEVRYIPADDVIVHCVYTPTLLSRSVCCIYAMHAHAFHYKTLSTCADTEAY